MKKSTKVLLMAALCMAIAGAAFCIAGICFGFTFSQFVSAVEEGQMEKFFDFREERNSSARDEKSENEFFSARQSEMEQTLQNIESLDFELGVVQCNMIMWEREDFRLVGYNLPVGFEWSQSENNELEIDCEQSDWKFWEEQDGAVLEIYVPEGQTLKKVQISAGVGDITVEGGYLVCEELNLDSGVGECNLKADIQKKVEIEGGIGEVRLELKGKEEDFNYDLENGIGEVVIGGTRLKDLGTDQQIDHGASKDVAVENGIGSVTLLFSED